MSPEFGRLRQASPFMCGRFECLLIHVRAASKIASDAGMSCQNLAVLKFRQVLHASLPFVYL